VGIEFGETDDDQVSGLKFCLLGHGRLTIIRYGVSNIRELLGHKVDLNFIETNPAVRLEKD
jgi:phenylalanyl-tRNA synthetase alpha subunit